MVPDSEWRQLSSAPERHCSSLGVLERTLRTSAAFLRTNLVDLVSGPRDLLGTGSSARRLDHFLILIFVPPVTTTPRRS